MSLKKNLRNQKAQSTIEYILLVAVSIIALLAATGFWRVGGVGSRLDWHFNTVRQSIQGNE